MNGTLKQTIKGMLRDARETPDRPVSRSLAGVITLAITQYASGQLSVSIERRNKAPTDENWSKILEQWPEPVPEGVTPRPRSEGRTYRLVAEWPRPAEVAERAA
jgi:hypothetical protein